MVVQQLVSDRNSKTSSAARILIVDDEQDILDSLKDILELEMDDCIIEVASNVEHARLLAQSNKPDIALLDIKLGQNNGLDLIPEFKSINPEIGCIMMTAYRDNRYTVKAVRFGANDYLYKPVKPHKLIQAITQLLQHQRIKREIAEADRRFHTVFEQATQWLFIIDTEAHLLDVNQTAMDFISKTKESVVGKVFWETPWFALSLDAQKKLKEGMSEINALTLFNADLKIIDNENNTHVYSFYMKPVSDEYNNVEQILVECRNVTERKKIEKEIKDLNQALELRVKERTLELGRSLELLTEENKERERAQEQAQKSDKAKSDFLSRMSHELRTPLNAIFGFAQLLELDSSQLNESQVSNVEQIIDASDHLSNIINEILDLTAIEAGKLGLNLEDIVLDDILKECTSLMKPIAGMRQIKQIDNIRGKGYVVHADFTRLKQVLLNLLTNAVKYNIDNGTVTLDSEIIDKQRLRISITDTGEGLSEGDINKLFTSFERLNIKFNVEGVGIGLVIAKNLMELMGGTIGVTSTVGKGSRFWIELELANKETLSDEETPVNETKQSSSQNKLVLSVDDNLANLKLIENMLGHATGYDVISIDNAEAGLKIAEEKQPDLILMDINMPVMNGYEFLESLQNNEIISHIPVIAVTGNAAKGDIENGRSAGFKNYITKPFRIKQLVDAVDEILVSMKKEQ